MALVKEKLEERLRAALRKRQFVNRFSQIFLISSSYLIFAFIIFICDYLTKFPWPVRLFITISGLVFFVFWLPRRYRYLFAPPADELSFAREVERVAGIERPGGFNAILVSALEFSSGLGSGSRELRKRTVQLSQLPAFDPCGLKLYNRLMLKRMFQLFGLCMVIYTGWLLVSPATLGIFMGRAFGLPLLYPTRTKLVRIEYPKVAPRHKPLVLTVNADGVIPANGRVRISYDREGSFFLPLEPGDKAGIFVCQLKDPANDFSFQVRLGDARSLEYDVKVVSPPGVELGTVRLHPPEYLKGESARDLPLGGFEVAENSRFDLEILPDRKVTECYLDIGDRQFPMSRSQDRWVQKKILLKRPIRYSIRLVDENGIENDDRVYYPVAVRPDRLPTATLERPAQGAYYAPVSRLRWELTASDDFAISRMVLYYTVSRPDESGEQQLLREGDITLKLTENKRELRLSGELDLLTLKLSPGMSLTFTVRAWDACTFREEEEFGESVPHTVNIVSVEELRTIIQEELLHVNQMAKDIETDMKHQIRVIDMKTRERE